MKGRLDISKDANGFDKNPQNINRKGRPRVMISHVLHEMKQQGIEQVTKAQIVGLFESLLNCTEHDLNKYLNDKEQPMLNRIVIKAMLDKRGFEIIEKILDRVHGKAAIVQETTTQDVIIVETPE